MYHFTYAEILEDSGQEARRRERQAFQRAIDLLEVAEERGPGTPEAVEALFFVQRLWTILSADLASDDNALPEALRASLISIGIWITKEVDAIRNGRTRSFHGLIDINTIICEGLR